MSAAIRGIEPAELDPGCRFAHPGYALLEMVSGPPVHGGMTRAMPRKIFDPHGMT